MLDVYKDKVFLPSVSIGTDFVVFDLSISVEENSAMSHRHTERLCMVSFCKCESEHPLDRVPVVGFLV